CVERSDITARLFRRHVSGGAHDCAVARDLGDGGGIVSRVGFVGLQNGDVSFDRGRKEIGGGGENLRKAPVHDQNFAERADHDVGRLEIAVKHAAGVRESDGVADPKEYAKTIGDGSDGSKVLVEALTLDEFHGVEDATVGESADVMNGNDAGM